MHLTIPVDFSGDLNPDALVSVTDRDVIPARGGVAASVVPAPFSDLCAVPAQGGRPGCNYQTIARADTR